MLRISDPLLALDLDVALALRIGFFRAERRPVSAGVRPDPDVVAAGDRYDGPDLWTRPLEDDERARASRAAYLATLEREGMKTH